MSAELEYIHFIRKDMGLIDSAVHAPFQTFGGEDLYPNIIDKAARLCYAIACNHGFVDGNKRTGLHSMFVLLEVNEIHVSYEADEIEALIIALVDKRITYEDFSDWLRRHCTFSET